MIISKRHPMSIIRRLEESMFDFHLTGSRLFGGALPTSDWDYFVRDSKAVREFLTELNFHTETDPMNNYNDSTIVDVWRWNDIHIQLVSDVNHKIIAQNMLLDYADMKGAPKQTRKYLWNMALALTSKVARNPSFIEFCRNSPVGKVTNVQIS